MPGVSTNTTWASGRVSTPRTWVRVVWGLSDTMVTFWPRIWFNNVDLPTLGRPTRVTKPDFTIAPATRSSVDPAGSLGFALVLIACVNWSVGSMISRQIEMPPGAMATVVEMAAAACGFALLAIVTGEEIAAPTWRSGIAALYLALLGSVIAFSCYVYLLANVRPSLALSYAYVNPIIAVLFGAAISGEPLGITTFVANGMIVIAVLLAVRRPTPVPEAERPSS